MGCLLGLWAHYQSWNSGGLQGALAQLSWQGNKILHLYELDRDINGFSDARLRDIIDVCPSREDMLMKLLVQIQSFLEETPHDTFRSCARRRESVRTLRVVYHSHTFRGIDCGNQPMNHCSIIVVINNRGIHSGLNFS